MALRSYADGTLFGERHGSGPPTVLAMHGWGRDRTDFAAVLDGLDAIALDLPGFGASPAPSRPGGAAAYADQIIPVLEEFPAAPIVVGHSFGGRVAVAAAAARPDLVKALVLVGVPLLKRDDRPPSRPPLGYRLIRWAARRGLVGQERLEAARARHGSADYRAASGVLRDVLVTVVNEEYRAELAALHCPVRLVWGGDDADVPVSVAERAAQLISGDVELHVLDGVGHLVPIARPDAIGAAIEALA